MEMRDGSILVRAGRTCIFVAVLSLLFAAHLGAQGRDGAQGPGATAPRAAAPDDLTGYWVSIVTELWRYRMIVPDKGDFVKVPLNPEGRRVADSWDLAKDQASADQCKGYGAAGIMQIPGRLHIYWQDDSTLRIDTDSGTQTRLLHFGGSAPPNEAPTWQGYSTASWEGDEPNDRRDGQGGPAVDSTGSIQARDAQKKPDYLKVVTTHMRPGYLQKNGVPYSGNATVEEYFDRFSYGGNTWLTVTAVVTDPQYLLERRIVHAHFKKIPDGSGWDPTPCRADQPR